MNLAVLWKWISTYNDVMIHTDVYPQKMHNCSKNIRGISEKYIIGDTAWIFA